MVLPSLLTGLKQLQVATRPLSMVNGMRYMRGQYLTHQCHALDEESPETQEALHDESSNYAFDL